MIIYEVKLKKIGEMTTLPDSQRLFGFLINNSKKYCSEFEISSFVRDVREQKQKCMISNLVPSGYYPTPKDLVMKNLQGRLKKNQEEIINFEKEQMELKSKSETIVKTIIEKNNKKKENDADNKLDSEEKEKLNEELTDLKSNLEEIKVCFNKNSEHINNISSKNIYETIKKMDFIDQSQLKELLKLGEDEGIIEVNDLLKFKYIKKNQTFIQKFRLENQIRQLPGLPNVAYSLPILSFENQEGDVQLNFSFFVKVMEETCISKTLEAMKEITDTDENDMYGHKIPCFLGGKGSSGYNEYSIYNIKKLTEGEDAIHSSVAASYLNMGMLLPDFDIIDSQNSLLDIHTSDRKPFEIENEVPKIISFVTAGSIIKLKQDKTDLYEIGKSIDNSKYNPMYNKNAIIFGNSYLVKLEVN